MCITYIDKYMHMSIYTFFLFGNLNLEFAPVVSITVSPHQGSFLPSPLPYRMFCLSSENPGTQQYQLIHLFAQSCNSSSIGSKLLLHLPLQKNNPRKSSGFICCFVPVIQSIQSNMVFINFLNQLFLPPFFSVVRLFA